ncbi:MAG: hypothetical protein ACXU9K_08645 [Thermodesulfobacteriota bacterium]
MKVFVNDRPFDLLAGMTVKHALVAAGLLTEVGSSKRAYDQWGNELGLGGALSEGMKIYVRSSKSPTCQ